MNRKRREITFLLILNPSWMKFINNTWLSHCFFKTKPLVWREGTSPSCLKVLLYSISLKQSLFAYRSYGMPNFPGHLFAASDNFRRNQSILRRWRRRTTRRQTSSHRKTVNQGENYCQEANICFKLFEGRRIVLFLCLIK